MRGLVLGVLLALPELAAAQIHCDPDDSSKCSAPLSKGTPAPYSGQLLTAKLAIDLGFKADECEVRTKLEIGYAKKQAQLELKYEQSTRKNDTAAHVLEMAAMESDRDRWKKHADVPFYEKPLFVAVLTAVLVTAVFVGADQIDK